MEELWWCPQWVSGPEVMEKTKELHHTWWELHLPWCISSWHVLCLRNMLLIHKRKMYYLLSMCGEIYREDVKLVQFTWVTMTLTNSSSIVAASTQSCWAGLSAWLSISDCRTSSKCNCRCHNKTIMTGMMKKMIHKKSKLLTFPSAVWLAFFCSSRAARASYTWGKWVCLISSPCRTSKPGHVVLEHS